MIKSSLRIVEQHYLLSRLIYAITDVLERLAKVTYYTYRCTQTSKTIL